jgi:hypothetical protein
LVIRVPYDARSAQLDRQRWLEEFASDEADTGFTLI